MRKPELARGQRKTALTIDPEAARDMTTRLARIEGQVQAIARMIDQRRKCELIVQQLSAARTALERATAQLMVKSLAQCILSSVAAADAEDVRRLTDAFVELLC
jgi:DNA-binding FrmR family transcriptional regulator